MATPEPTPEQLRLVHSLVESGQLTPEQAELYLAETRRAPPGSLPTPPSSSGSASRFGSAPPSGFGSAPPSGFGSAPLLRSVSQSDATRPRAGTGPLSWSSGAVVGAYRLEDRLGRGGAGEVWRVTHLPTGAARALKTLLPFAEPQERTRFLREAQALARLDGHPNVVRIHDVGEHDRRIFLVMDLARPEDLHKRLKAGPLPSEAARALLADLAAGLAHVHALGFMHRDLKPQNVLFADDGRPLLSDFGLVRGASRTSLSVTGEILGTPSYMAPEQAMGDPVDERTDVYGLGAVLFACLTGRPPFQGRTPITVLQQVMTQAPPAPSSLAPDVDRDLERICLKALSKAKEQRFPTARALRAALLERDPGATAGRPRLLWGAGLLVALGAAGAGALAVALRRHEPPPPRPASARVQPAESAPAQPAESVEALDLDAYVLGLAADAELDLGTFAEPTAALLEKEARPLEATYAKTRDTKDGLRAARVLARWAQVDPRGLRHLAELIMFVSSNAHVGLPRDAERPRVAAGLLERAGARGEAESYRQLGRGYEQRPGDVCTLGHSALPRDPAQALAYYCRGIAPPDEEDETRVAHAEHSCAVWRQLTPEEARAVAPELRLALVEEALRLPLAEQDPDLAAFLIAQRTPLQREVGDRHLQDLAQLPETEWEALRATDVFRKASAVFPLRSARLHQVGQNLSDLLTHRRSDLSEAELTAMHTRDSRWAAACLLRAAEEGAAEAWGDLATLLLRGTCLALPDVDARRAARAAALWRGAEQGDMSSITSLCFEHVKEARRLPAAFERVAAALRLLPQDASYPHPVLKLKVSYAAALLLQAEPESCPLSREQVRTLLHEAIRAHDAHQRRQAFVAECEALLEALDAKSE